MNKKMFFGKYLTIGFAAAATCGSLVAQEKPDSSKIPKPFTEQAATENEGPVAVGEQAPDFDLESLNGKTVKLSDLVGENGKPVVLLFSRAHW